LWFDTNNPAIHGADRDLIRQAAEFLRQNPSLNIGIDNSNASGSSSQVQSMKNQRVGNIRSALIDAGVDSSRIETGTFSNPNLANDNRVDLLLRSRPVR
jgi:outer membrane protein OmpA-like peptidoglycan-associated protein